MFLLGQTPSGVFLPVPVVLAHGAEVTLGGPALVLLGQDGVHSIFNTETALRFRQHLQALCFVVGQV